MALCVVGWYHGSWLVVYLPGFALTPNYPSVEVGNQSLLGWRAYASLMSAKPVTARQYPTIQRISNGGLNVSGHHRTHEPCTGSLSASEHMPLFTALRSMIKRGY